MEEMNGRVEKEYGESMKGNERKGIKRNRGKVWWK